MVTAVPGRRADIDGLRAIAALTVLVYHVLEATGRGNFVILGGLGVSGFFGLSGYLVTAMLATEHARTGRIDVRAFWRRRAARLAPALLAMVAVVGPVAAMLGASSVADALTAITPWSNVVMRSESALGTGFGHVWSIAIEAQFYALWPAVIPLLLRLRRPSPWLLAAAAIIMGWRTTLPYEAAYYGTIARADAFLVGGAIALSGRARVTVPWTGWLAPVGVRSYGLYLWHVPILFIAGPVVPMPVLIGLSFALAATSWRYVEAPAIRRLGRRTRGGPPQTPGKAFALFQIRRKSNAPHDPTLALSGLTATPTDATVIAGLRASRSDFQIRPSVLTSQS